MGKPLYNYQKEILTAGCSEPLRLILSSRQTGKSTTLAVEALIDCLFNDGYTVLMISLTERKGADLLDKSRGLLHRFGDEHYKNNILTDNYTELRFKNGSRILSLSSDPDSARGYTADSVLVDEFPHLPCQEDILDAVSPSAFRQGRIALSGTPNGIGNMFYTLWTTEMSCWRIEIPWTRCPDFTEEKIERERELCKATGRNFAAEFELSFDRRASSIWSIGQIEDCIIPQPEKPVPHIRIAGYDPARDLHNSGLVVVDVEAGRKEVIHIQNLKGMPIPDQATEVMRVMDSLGVNRLYMDEGGGYGKSLWDLMASHQHKIKLVNWTAKMKRELIYRIKTDTENGRCKFWNIPLLPALKHDMVSVDPNSNELFVENSNGHCDYIASLMLAYTEFKSPILQPSVRSAYSFRGYGAPLADQSAMRISF